LAVDRQKALMGCHNIPGYAQAESMSPDFRCVLFGAIELIENQFLIKGVNAIQYTDQGEVCVILKQENLYQRP